jgi:hypothetical protein
LVTFRRPRGESMNDAQIGLLITVPLIGAMALTLNRAGALGTTAAIAAVALAAIFAAVLFFSQ